MSVVILLLHLSAHALMQMTVPFADCNGKPCSLLNPYAERSPTMHILYIAYPLHILSCLLSSQLLQAQSFCFICRVDAVQLALSSLTSIPPQEQILLLNGNPLDPGKPLGAYQLPTVSKHTALHSPFTLKQTGFTPRLRVHVLRVKACNWGWQQAYCIALTLCTQSSLHEHD